MHDRFDLVVATRDWHPKNQVSFASNNSGKHICDKINIRGITQILRPGGRVNGRHCMIESAYRYSEVIHRKNSEGPKNLGA